MKNCPVCGADLSKRPDELEKLMSLWKKRSGDVSFMSFGERILLERLVKQYGYDKVLEAFVEACSDPARMKISYVRGILRGDVHKAAASRNVAEAAVLKKASVKGTKIGGFDFSDIVRRVGEQPAAVVEVKEKAGVPFDRDKAQRDFENDLRKNDPEEYEKYMRAKRG